MVLMSYHAAPIVYPINYFILKSTLRTDRKIDAAMKTSYVSRRKFRGRWRTRVLSRTGIFIFQVCLREIEGERERGRENERE